MVESLYKRLLLISVAFIMAIGLLEPALAFADEGGGGSHSFGGSYPIWGTVWYTNTNNDSDNMYGVVANTNWDAALFCLGYNDGSDDFSNLFTPAIKAKLLTGNNAYQQFANKFKVGKPEIGGSGIVGGIFSPEIDFQYAWSTAKELYGETYCYSARFGVAERSAARDYVNEVLAEGGGSGGGGTVQEGLSIAMKIDALTGYDLSNNSYTAKRVSSYSSTGVPSGSSNVSVSTQSTGVDDAHTICDEIGLYCVGSVYEQLKAYKDDGYDVYISVQLTNSSRAYLTVCAVPDGHSSFTNGTVTITGGVSYYTLYSTYNNYYDDSVQNNGLFIYVPGNTVSLSTKTASTYSLYSFSSGRLGAPTYYEEWDGEYGGGGGDDPIEPPVTWPDPPTPVTPNPPEVPTPPDPTPPEPPDPTPPDPPTPWIPIPGPDDDPITGDDFQDLLDALAEHCQHIRDAISDNFEQLWTNQSDLLVTEFSSTRDTLTDNLQWLGNDVIAQGFTDLNGYLNDLFEWLADQMEFNVSVNDSPYDDSSVLYWLKRIWAKLGTGDINIRPTDPVADNDAWWSWLLQLMDNFVGFLLGFGLDKLGDVGSALQSLTGKFPFSLPWDLAALFGLLVATPQTPAVDFPCFALGLDGIQQVGVYHLSLADYDTAWEQVRWLERLSFCILLIKSSDFFTSLLGKVFGK